MAETLGAKFTIDITDLKAGITQANRLIRESRSEFKAAAAGMGDWTKSEEGLTKKLESLNKVQEIQKEKVSALQKEYDRLIANGTDPASKAAVELRTKINDQKAALAETESEIAKYTSSLGELEEENSRTETATEKLKKAISDEEAELQKLKQSYTDAVIAGNKDSEQTAKLSREIESLSSTLAENKQKMQDAENAADKFDNSLGELDDSTSDVNDGFTVFKATLANIAATAISKAIDGIKELSKEVIQTGEDFTASLSKVQAVSGASGEQLEQLEQKARELGESTKFSATEVSDAFNYMAMAGWKTEDMLNGIDGILSLSAADGLELATVSDIVTDSLTAFGLSANDAGHFADVLAQAGRNANTNVSMLGESFKYVAPVAGSLGYSVEDVSIALGLMANSGIKASQSGTALRTLLTNLSKPTDEMSLAMDYLGISLQNSDGKMKTFSEVMDNLRDAFSGCQMPMDEFQQKMTDLNQSYETGEITEQKYNKAIDDLIDKAYGAEGALKAKYAATIAGKQGMAGLLAIVNTGKGDFDKLSDAINNADGTAKNMADTMQNNLTGDLTTMNSELEGVRLNLYDKIEPVMRDVISDVNEKIIPGINELIDNLPTVGIVVAGVTAAITAFKVASISAKLATEGLTIATELQSIAQGVLNTVMEANPIGLVILAITGLAAGFKYLWDNCDGFREFFINMGEEIKEAWQNSVQFIKDKVEEWKQKFDDLKTKISEIKNNIVQSFEEIKTGMKEKIEDAKTAVQEKFESIKTGIVEKAQSIKDNIKAKFEEAKEAITTPIENAKAKVLEIIQKIKDAFHFEWSLPHLKIPKLHLNSGEAPWGFGGKGRLPSMSIEYLAKGGIVKGATAAVVGEDGAEAVMPLEKNLEYLDKMADRVARRLDTGKAQPVNVYQTNNYSTAHSRYEIYKSRKAAENAVRLAVAG